MRESLSLLFSPAEKMARSLKFLIKEVEGFYYLYSENKGTDQLCSNFAAELRLCFRICRKQSFSLPGSF